MKKYLYTLLHTILKATGNPAATTNTPKNSSPLVQERARQRRGEVKLLYTLLLPLLISISAYAQTNITIKPEQQSATAFPSGEPLKTAGFTYNIIPAPGNTWCYDILKDGNLFIHQPSIPGMPGHNGFNTKEQAAKVAQLVITKMKQGEMPPTVSEEELKKLNAI